MKLANTIKVFVLEILEPVPSFPDIVRTAALHLAYITALAPHLEELEEVAVILRQIRVSEQPWDRSPFKQKSAVLAKLLKLRALRILDWPLAPRTIAEGTPGADRRRVGGELM